MRANLRRKQSSLARADAVVAVSHRVAADLRRHAPDLIRTRIETIPNGVDVAAVRAAVKGSPSPIGHPYALFVGKLAKNKGADLLVDVAERADLQMPLVVVGDGPERATIENAAIAGKRDVRIVGWQNRDEVFRWMYHATVLIFPSNCVETLSRVLIEASALGVPIAAMNTGGTEDIVVNEATGLLSTSVAGLAADVVRLTHDPELRARLAERAAVRARSEFDLPVVISRMEKLYRDLVHGS
jgi:glycosyltransferase involved in cell wall biosynthesis